MRLLHVISGLGVGGAETFLSRLAPLLRDAGFDQTVVSLTGQGAMVPVLEKAGIPVVALRMGSPISGFSEIAKLRSLMQKIQPDIVQGWMYHGDLAAALAHRLAGTPGRLFWGVRCSDMDLGGYSLKLRLSVRLCAAISGQPEMVIANSFAGVEAHKEIGYEPKRFEIIHNGVDVDLFRPDAEARAAVRAELGIAPEARVVVHVARVDPMKDHATMMAAVESLKDITTMLVGSGTQRLPQQAGVIALGRRTDVARLLAAGDVVVSSSAFGEGFPNGLAEGMSAGLVPVATDVGDSRIVVGDTGRLVPPSDPAALSAALSEILGRPADEWPAMRQAARARIASTFTLAEAARRFVTLYKA